jgi:hypothetical protein
VGIAGEEEGGRDIIWRCGGERGKELNGARATCSLAEVNSGSTQRRAAAPTQPFWERNKREDSSAGQRDREKPEKRDGGK